MLASSTVAILFFGFRLASSSDPLGEGEKKTNAAAGKHTQIVALCRIFDAMSLLFFFVSRFVDIATYPTASTSASRYSQLKTC